MRSTISLQSIYNFQASALLHRSSIGTAFPSSPPDICLIMTEILIEACQSALDGDELVRGKVITISCVINASHQPNARRANGSTSSDKVVMECECGFPITLSVNRCPLHVRTAVYAHVQTRKHRL